MAVRYISNYNGLKVTMAEPGSAMGGKKAYKRWG